MQEIKKVTSVASGPENQPAGQLEYVWLCGQIEACSPGCWSDIDIQAVSGSTAERVLQALERSAGFAKADLLRTLHEISLPPGELESLLTSTLEKLPEKMRLLVALLHKEGLTVKEAAEVLRQTAPEAQREYCKALIVLRAGLEQEQPPAVQGKSSGQPDARTSSIVKECESIGTGKEAGAARTEPAGPQIELVEGNLLNQNVDVIVNAWNRNLVPYWLLVTQGVSGAIKRAAGTSPFKELRKLGILPLGAARLTSAGALPFKGIIHVAGINHMWRSSDGSVRKSVINALAIARNEGFSSIAFPAIGAGSCLSVGGREFPVWGVSTKRSLQIIEEEARQSDYQGRVMIVKFKRDL